jgi:hypothetical protein
MRLKEEKVLILLGIISVLIILDILFLQIADSKISKHNNELTTQHNYLNTQQGRLLNAVLAKNWHKDMSLFISYFKPKIELDINSHLEFESTGVENTDNKNNLRKNLLKKVKQNQLSLEDFYYNMAQIYTEEYIDLYNQYHQMTQGYLKKSSSGTIWTSIKKYLFVIEIVLILLNLFGYAYLFKSISLRTKIERKEND